MADSIKVLRYGEEEEAPTRQGYQSRKDIYKVTVVCSLVEKKERKANESIVSLNSINASYGYPGIIRC